MSKSATKRFIYGLALLPQADWNSYYSPTRFVNMEVTAKRSKTIALLAAVFSLGVVQAASAADMPTKMPAKAPMIAPAPVYSWTGFYVGLNAGY